MSKIVIHAQNLPWTTYANRLQQYFSQFGRVSRVKVQFDEVTGMSKCNAFVEFKNSDVMLDVLLSKKHEIDSKKIEVRQYIR